MTTPDDDTSTAGGHVRRVAVVPHVHWDREWYQSFQAFRLRLVELLDAFLPKFDSDPSYTHFLLDGQMAVIDDYLEVRPEARALIVRLAASGRLAVGPWYILMDEFLVSAETIVRNLQLGLERAAGFGGAMAVGYLPDMFGHIAQMPQILRQAGFAHTVVWRGVPSAVDRTAFWWQAPDGSRIRAEYLPVGYGNGAALPEDAKALVRRVAAHEIELGALLPDRDTPLLLMNGTDHQVPQPWLGRVVAEANAIQDSLRFEITTIADYVASAPTTGLATWNGELRSGARANLLMGVASNRVDVHQAARRAEQGLERQAEPLCALWLAPDQWPGAELDLAWGAVIRNSAHDSICACSVDDVALAVLDRFAQATAIAEGLRARAVKAAGPTMAAAGPVVINPAARAAGGVVELLLAGNRVLPGVQPLTQVSAALGEAVGTGADLGVLLGRLAVEGYPTAGDVVGAELDVEAGGVELTIRTGPGQIAAAGTSQVMAEAWAQAGAHRDQPLRVRVHRQAWQRVLTHVADVPGFGWQAWEPAPLTIDPVSVVGATLANGLVRIEVDDRDGTFSLNGRPGYNRLVDGGDEGDTYNYSPPAFDREVDQPTSVSIAVATTGPVRGALRVTRSYEWPAGVADGRRTGQEAVTVITDIELQAGEPFVRLTTSFVNRCRDHRLRAWFPLPRTARSSSAECAFAVVQRGLGAEGGPHERGLPTFPSRRFVMAGGLTVLHEGLLEYEITDGGNALALTLLRATGMLSRDHPAYRPNAAGPAIAVEGPQLQGRVELRYALHDGDDDPYALADQAWLPLEVAYGSGGGRRGSRGSDLSVIGAEVSALRRVAGGLEIRVFNPTDTPTTVSLGSRPGWLVDLRGAPIAPFDDGFALGPWMFATARLPDPA